MPKSRLVYFFRCCSSQTTERQVKLILTCLNSDFVTNDFYLPERHTSLPINLPLLPLRCSCTKQLPQLNPLWLLLQFLDATTWSWLDLQKCWRIPTLSKLNTRRHAHTSINVHSSTVQHTEHLQGTCVGRSGPLGLGCSCITSTLWRSSRDNSPGFSLIQLKQQTQSEAQPHLERDSITADSRNSLAKTEFIDITVHYKNLIMDITRFLLELIFMLAQDLCWLLTWSHDMKWVGDYSRTVGMSVACSNFMLTYKLMCTDMHWVISGKLAVKVNLWATQ